MFEKSIVFWNAKPAAQGPGSEVTRSRQTSAWLYDAEMNYPDQIEIFAKGKKMQQSQLRISLTIYSPLEPFSSPALHIITIYG